MQTIFRWLRLTILSIVLLFVATGVAALISNYDLVLPGGLPSFLFLFGAFMVALAILRPGWCSFANEEKVGPAKEVLLMGGGLILASGLVFLAGSKMIFAGVVGGISLVQLFRTRAEAFIRARVKKSEPSKDLS